MMNRLIVLPVALLAALLLPAPGASPPRAAEEGYVIGPEDVIEIQVWEKKDLNQTVFVRPDGRTSLPLVGEVHAAGKTVQELQEYLTGLYEKTVKEAAVTVIVKEIKSRPVYFVGGFGKPGAIQLTREMTLVQAISVVGGVLPTADAENGFLLRGDKRIPIDFVKLLQRGDLSQNVALRPEDSVVVAIADQVYVQGEVKAPAPIKHTSDLTLLKAIAQTGGLTPLAAAGRVDILRGKGEKRERIRVDLDRIMRAPNEHPDVSLRPEDIIFVPQRLF